MGPPAHAAGDLLIEASASYELQPATEQLAVSIRYTLTNAKPDAVTDTTRTRYFFDTHRVALPPDAQGVTATDFSGGPLTVSDELIELDDGSQGRVVIIALPRSIYYQETTELTLSFIVDGGAPRTPSRIRVNPAYAAFWVRAWGDPGLSDVEVAIPAGFAVEHSGSDVARRNEEAAVVWYSDVISEPEDWTVFFNARNDSELTSFGVDFDGIEIDVRSWPGDEVWASWATDVVDTGFAALQDAIVIDVGETQLAVVESLDPALTGYAGWYLRGEATIELGEALDTRVLLHELSHLWFNQELFAQRWVNEGLASAYASEFEPLVGGAATDRVTTAPSEPAVVALNSWVVPTGSPSLDADVALTEQYGYAASEYVVTSLLLEIGVHDFASVFTSAEQNLIAYRDIEGSETVGPVDDWRRFLDLLQETGGSESAGDLFAQYVVEPDDVTDLEERRAARSGYAELTARDGTWVAPVGLRRAMSNWDWPLAKNLTEAAGAVIEVRDTMVPLAATLGVAPPAAVRDGYEAASVALDLETAASLARIHLVTLETLMSARSALDAPRGFFTSIGLHGHDLESKWRRATAAFEANDTAASNATASEMISLLEGGHDAGRLKVLRIGLLAAALAAIAVAGVWSVQRQRRDQLSANG